METNKIKQSFIVTKIIDNFSVLSIVLLVIFFTISNPNFLGSYNLKNLFTDIGPLLVMGCGATFVLLQGSIDLSIGSICSCGAVFFVSLLDGYGGYSYIIVMLFGLAAGLLNGVLYTFVRIPSFIATLGTMSLWQSVALIAAGGAPLAIEREYWELIDWNKAGIGIIAMPFILALIVLLLCFILLGNTRVGKFIYAIGANERASRISGVNVPLAKLTGFAVSGLCAALSGIFLAAKLKSGSPMVGEPFTLMAIASVALGGTSLSGGRGGVFGTLLGVALIIVIENGMNIIAVDPFWRQVVFGIIVILAVYITVDRSGRNLVIK